MGYLKLVLHKVVIPAADYTRTSDSEIYLLRAHQLGRCCTRFRTLQSPQREELEHFFCLFKICMSCTS